MGGRSSWDLLGKLLHFLSVVGDFDAVIVTFFVQTLQVLDLQLELFHLCLELVMHLRTKPRLLLVNRHSFLQSFVAGTIPVIMHLVFFHEISHALCQHLVLRCDPIALSKKCIGGFEMLGQKLVLVHYVIDSQFILDVLFSLFSFLAKSGMLPVQVGFGWVFLFWKALSCR